MEAYESAADVLTRLPVRGTIDVDLPEQSLLSRCRFLADVRAGAAVLEVETVMDGVTVGEPVAQHVQGDVLRLLVPGDDGPPQWVAVEGTDVWSIGLAVLLWLDGVVDGGGSVGRSEVLAAAPAALHGVVGRSLDELGWQDDAYRAAVVEQVREPGRLGLTVDLRPERGLGQDAMRIAVSVVVDAGATVPPPPETGEAVEPEAFISSLAHDWPDGTRETPSARPDDA